MTCLRHSVSRSVFFTALVTGALSCGGSSPGSTTQSNVATIRPSAHCYVDPNPALVEESYRVVGEDLGRSKSLRVDVHAPDSTQSLEVLTTQDGAFSLSLQASSVGAGLVEVFAAGKNGGARFLVSCEFDIVQELGCGNGVCEGGEGCESCAVDCGVCAPVCGDGVCDATESCETCEVDCDVCPPACGDGLCAATEVCSCTADCGACPPGPGDGPFLGNIFQGSVASDFDAYWNQMTPENAGKWGSVESSRDRMSWSALDRMFDHARSRGLPVKEHTFVWRPQQPSWIGSLPEAEQREEVEEWISQFCARYPDVRMIDVVNEPLHAPPTYIAALGGAGSTGWDWVIWVFEKARQHCPGADLLINDYGILGNLGNTQAYANLIALLQGRGLIDGIGCQGHGLESRSAASLQQSLDILAGRGLPIYISEYDINSASDSTQLSIMQQQFPVFWQHASVAGVTFWGYREGNIWRPDAYLVRTDGSERPAMQWLQSYVASGQ